MSTNKAEQAVAYAALILADEASPITPEKLQALLKAAGIEDVEPIWTTLFANALQDKDVKEILTTVAASALAVGGETAGGGQTDGHDHGEASVDGGDEDGSDSDAGSDGDFGDLFG